MIQKLCFLILVILSLTEAKAQLFQDDFGTAFGSISTTKWPTACRGGSPSSFNTSAAPCGSVGERAYALSGFSQYVTTQAITIPSSGYDLAFEYSFNLTFSFPVVEIRTGAACGTTLAASTTLTNTSGSCNSQVISLNAFAGQTIYIRFRSNTSSATFYLDEILVDLAGGGGGTACLLTDDFGTAFASIDATNWPSACRGGTASGFNTSTGPCFSTGDYNYALSGFGSYITSMALAIPSTGFDLTFDYSFNLGFSFPAVEIRTGGPCGTSLATSTTLSNTSGVCTPQTINLNAYAGQTIYIRFRSNTSSSTFYLDEVNVCGAASSTSDLKWADNFNDNDLNLDYAGTDGDEACTGCGTWTLGGGSSLELVPSGAWNGNSNETEAFIDNMPNVYYVKLDRNEYLESPTIDLSSQESFKISFYAKSSSPGTGGGDTWSFSDRLRLQFWDGSSWNTITSLRDDLSSSWSNSDDFITSGLPFNYYCFTAYKNTTSPGNHYYNSSPNVNTAYFHSDFKFRVIFEGGFSGSPFAWVDDFTFRADADGYSTMIPCGISFWNEPSATSYGQDAGTSGNNNAEKGVELELDNAISIPPNWVSEANDGDVQDQVFGAGESERVVFAVISEQEINFAFPKVHFYAPSMGWQSSIMSIDNNYTGPGWKYHAVEYISCDLAGGSIAEPTDDFQYYYSFEYGNEFIPVFYQLNTSGIEYGGGVTSALETFNAPDMTSTDNCGIILPVELLSFDVTQIHNKVKLNWQTASEIDNAHFDIERSTDGLYFNKIGAVQGQDASSTIISYSFDDSSPLTGISYYRLKQVDVDGEFEYSETRAVNFIQRGSGLNLYPNPAFDIITLNYEVGSLDDLIIVDFLGKIVSDQVKVSPLNKSEASIDISLLSDGVYSINIGFESIQFVKF